MQDMPKSESGGVLEKLVPVLLLMSIALAFVVGMLWQKVSLLQGGGAALTNPNQQQQQADGNQPQQPPSGKLTADQVKKIPPVTDKDHIRGDKNAQVVIIEYSDYQCPYCKQFHPTMLQIMKEYSGKVAWVYRHFPLDQIHPNARPAANAAECVFALGGDNAFWKFTDEVFANQDKYLTDLASAAVAVGVNKQKFQTCLDAKQYEKIIDEDLQGGTSAGITGTPGNLIMNKKGDAWLIPGALPFQSMKQTIDEALK